MSTILVNINVAKGGKEIYLQATYNPVFDSNGKAIRVIKVASDITDSKLASIKAKAHTQAIDRSLATIEFELDGTIIDSESEFS